MGSSPTGSWLSFASVGGAMLIAILITRTGGLIGSKKEGSGKTLADIEGQETDATVPVIDINTGEVQDYSQEMSEQISHYSGEQQQDPSAHYGAYSVTETPYQEGGENDA